MITNNLSQENVDQEFKKFKYKPILNFKSKVSCKFITYKTETFFFAANSNGNLKVFGFNNRFKLMQTLSYGDKKNCFKTIVFMKKSNQLLLGNCSGLIIIWNYSEKCNLYQINAHHGSVNSLIFNENEDLIISGGLDGQIMFWKKINKDWSCWQSIEGYIPVVSLCLNFSETKLIVSGAAENIRMVQLQSNLKWSISQQIETINDFPFGYFVNDYQYILAKIREGFLEIYNYNYRQKQYIKSKQIELKKDTYYFNPFPAQFIREKNILIVNFGEYLYFFGIDKNGNYMLQQQIQYIESYIFARVTDNAKFLVTCESYSYKIQISILQNDYLK